MATVASSLLVCLTSAATIDR